MLFSFKTKLTYFDMILTVRIDSGVRPWIFFFFPWNWKVKYREPTGLKQENKSPKLHLGVDRTWPLVDYRFGRQRKLNKPKTKNTHHSWANFSIVSPVTEKTWETRKVADKRLNINICNVAFKGGNVSANSCYAAYAEARLSPGWWPLGKTLSAAGNISYGLERGIIPFKSVLIPHHIVVLMGTGFLEVPTLRWNIKLSSCLLWSLVSLWQLWQEEEYKTLVS